MLFRVFANLTSGLEKLAFVCICYKSAKILYKTLYTSYSVEVENSYVKSDIGISYNTRNIIHACIKHF